MSYSLVDNGFYFDKNFISQKDISKLENDILTLTECKNSIDFSNLCVRLDKEDKNKLFELNKFINRHHIVTSLQNNLINSFNNHQISFEGNFPLYLGGGFLFGLPKDDRLTYNWHQESNYMPNFDNLFNAWLPLFFENSENNGTMTIIDKSHLYGRLSYTRIDKPGGFCDLVTNVDMFDLNKDLYICNAKPGEAYIFDQNTVHRSNYNSGDLTRFSITVRYAFTKKQTAVDNWKKFY